MVFKSSKNQKSRCCNPFNYEGHYKTKGTRLPSQALVKAFTNLSREEYLCKNCRDKVYTFLKQNSDGIAAGTKLTLPTFIASSLKKGFAIILVYLIVILFLFFICYSIKKVIFHIGNKKLSKSKKKSPRKRVVSKKKQTHIDINNRAEAGPSSINHEELAPRRAKIKATQGKLF